MFDDLIKKAAETENQSEAKAGGDFEYTPPAAGKTIARFIEYIELGKHVELYEGKPKPPAEMVRVTFELLHPQKNIKEIEIEGGKKTIADRLSITMPKKQTEKAKFFKLFKAMAQGRSDIVHMAQMLNEEFIVDVKHNVSEKDKKTYANIYADGTWHVFAPYVEDPLAGTRTKVPVPAAISPLKLFLWGNPTKETWDSLFIDGEREVKNADGTTRKESKNWLQNSILSATDYGGSALEQMLAGVDNLPTSEPANAGTPEGTATATQSANASAPADTQTPATVTKTATAEDALKALGL